MWPSQGNCVIAQDVWSGIVKALEDSKYFSLQTDETTDIPVTQQMAIMLRFFDNTLGTVRCVFFMLESIRRATAEQLIDKHFQESGPLSYDNIIGLGTDCHAGEVQFSHVLIAYAAASHFCNSLQLSHSCFDRQRFM